MLPLASDEDANGNILRGLLRRMPDLDLVRSQDVIGKEAPDTEVLAWAAADGRVLISNDRKTMIDEAKKRYYSGKPMPGVIATSDSQSIGDAINDILFIAEVASRLDFLRDPVLYLPY